MNPNQTRDNTVTPQQFTNSVVEVVQNYIDNFYEFDNNPILRVNPELLLVEVQNGYAFQKDIGYSDEVIEEAAYAEGDATESNTDFQAKQDYDFYKVTDFVTVGPDHKGSVNMDAVNTLTRKYFG